MIWIAHALTLARLPLAAAFASAASAGAWGWAFAIVIAAAATDAADGTVARWAKARGATSRASAWGDWLDPVADKVFVAVAVIAVAAARDAWACVPLIAAREIAFAASAPFVRWRQVELRARWIGKLATDAQLVAVGALVVWPAAAIVFAGIAAAMGLAAVADYARQYQERIAKLAVT